MPLSAAPATDATASTERAALERGPLPPAEACAALAAVIGPFAVVDLETTGLDPATARVVEVGAVIVRPGAEPEVFHRFVDPREPLPAFTKRFTGLTDADLAGAPSWDEASRALAERISGATVIAHNAAFEEAFLGGLLPRSTRFLDTLELACVLRPELAGHNLELLSRELLGRAERHRALDDALDTLALLAILDEGVRGGAHARLCAWLGAASAWSWAGIVREAARSAGPGDLRLVPDGAGRAVPARTGPPRPADGRLAPGVPREWLEPRFIRSLLADEPRWRAVFPGYRPRAGQIELACAILAAFRGERAFAAEAGTGIGKTLAYGLVAMLHALATGERVVVSSANRTLQERIVREEWPRIAAVLEVPPPPAMILKGRANYPSPRRMRDVVLDPDALGFPLAPASRCYVASVLERCRDRDLQGFGGWLASRDPVLWAVRERIACASDCDESACLGDDDGPCAYLSHVAALHQAGLASINHSLLLAWPARYGPIERLIVDEAHELAGEADRSFAEELRSRELRVRLRQLVGGHGGGGLIAALGAAGASARQAGATVSAAARGCARSIEAVGEALAGATGGSDAIVPPPHAVEPGSRWDHAARATAGLAAECACLADAVADLVACHRAATEGGDAVAAEAAMLGGWLAAVGRGLLADLFAQSRPETVYAARGVRRQETFDFALRATPVETAPLLHARLLDPARTVIAVSATLGVGGDPAPSLRKLGWYELEPERRLPSLVVPSPFDYRRNAVLALVRGDDYRQPGFAERCARSIADVATLLDGRTLALFTSRSRLSDVAGRLTPRLADAGIAVLAHDRAGGAARLVERFSADPRAVLLGTRSLWQGVDVPGDALSCVVIDKLPFPRPDDPLVRGRAERIRAAGGDPFRDLSLEPAVVAFKQMFGRLIRGEIDRGFVIVLGVDESKPYVQDFVASLPGPPRLLVADWPGVLAEMRAFFRPPAPADDGPAGG